MFVRRYNLSGINTARRTMLFKFTPTSSTSQCGRAILKEKRLFFLGAKSFLSALNIYCEAKMSIQVTLFLFVVGFLQMYINRFYHS